MTQRRALLEICIDSLTSACAARDGGADRLEVCAELAVGGLTPSPSLLGEVREHVNLPLHVLIRPRSGNFLYSDDEMNVMTRDIALARDAGAQGVVLGVLSANGTIDRERTATLAEAARPLDITFHRAFDFTSEPLHALETLVHLGLERVLTSGGRPSVPEGLDVLAQLIDSAGDRMTVMPGGGIRSTDVAHILDVTGAVELHASARRLPAPPPDSQGTDIRLGSGDSGHGPFVITDVEEVRLMASALHSSHA